MAVGFLAVFSELGGYVSLQEFQDWYNDEHVPLRMHLPSFLTAARYRAVDGLKPSWIALYDVDDTSTFQHESYTRLRANRSAREADLIARLEVLDRRTCELVFDSGESELTSSFALRNPSKFLVTHGLVVSDDSDTRNWQERAAGLLKKVEGWIRTRVFRCFDNVRTGTAVGQNPEEQLVPRFFVVHELQEAGLAASPGFQAAIRAPEVAELRTWALYRAYPGIAQGNLDATI